MIDSTLQPNVSPLGPENPLPSFDFKIEMDQLNSLVTAWQEEENNTIRRRKLRENRQSVDEARQNGVILEDETIIPDRTINSNVRRSKVPYTNYITQSKRTLIITDVNEPTRSIESLELWYTRGMRYPDWKTPWLEMIDGMHVHGGCALEVVYDTTKPFNVGIEYIRREDLIYPLKAKNLQSCPRLLRVYEVSAIQLDELAKDFGFDETIVKDLMQKFYRNEAFIKIYRVLLKRDGVVYNAWWSRDNTNGWLREPQVHNIGLFDFDPAVVSRPVPVAPPGMMMGAEPMMVPMFLSPQWSQQRLEFTQPAKLSLYPIVWFPFQVVESQELLQIQGRVSLDLHVQEAMTSLLSDTVNAAHRASRFYPSAETLPGEDPKMIELGPIKHGVAMSRQLTVFQPNWPNPIILAIQQALKIGKADESGQTDFAATARKDANKTAKEMELATEQANLVITSDMDVFSSPVLLVNALCFNIATHQAIFQLCPQPVHPELLIGNYNLQPAGDVEVVKRMEDKQNAKEFFNIVQGTPAAEKVLKFLIQRFFPDQADEWIDALEAPDKNALIAQLVSVLESIPTNELSPEQKLNLSQLITAARNVVEPSDNTAVSSVSGAPPGGNPPPVRTAEQTS